MSRAAFFPAVLLGFTFALVPGASAHTRTISYSTWRESSEGVEVALRTPWIEFRRAIPMVRDLSLAEAEGRPDALWIAAGYVGERLEVKRGNVKCRITSPTFRSELQTGTLVGSLSTACGSAGDYSLRLDLFFDAAPSHVHVARWEGRGGVAAEKILTESDRAWEPQGRDGLVARQARVGKFFRLGLRHILSGWDHLLFLAGFLLLGVPTRRLVGLVTAFTVAHSISLAAATLGGVRPMADGVESLIGFTIGMVALDGFGRMGIRSVPLMAVGTVLGGWIVSAFSGGTLPGTAWIGMLLFAMSYFRLAGPGGEMPVAAQWLVVFMFGLVHGFGFAGALLSSHFDPESAVPALLGFNLGVEIGQLGVLSMLLVGGRLACRWGTGLATARLACASILLAMGLFWYWSRLVP